MREGMNRDREELKAVLDPSNEEEGAARGRSLGLGTWRSIGRAEVLQARGAEDSHKKLDEGSGADSCWLQRLVCDFMRQRRIVRAATLEEFCYKGEQRYGP